MLSMVTAKVPLSGPSSESASVLWLAMSRDCASVPLTVIWRARESDQSTVSDSVLLMDRYSARESVMSRGCLKVLWWVTSTDYSWVRAWGSPTGYWSVIGRDCSTVPSWAMSMGCASVRERVFWRARPSGP